MRLVAPISHGLSLPLAGTRSFSARRKLHLGRINAGLQFATDVIDLRHGTFDDITRATRIVDLLGRVAQDRGEVCIGQVAMHFMQSKRASHFMNELLNSHRVM